MSNGLSRYCAFIGKDPITHLSDCTPQTYKTFFHWLCDTSRVRKHSYIYSIWRVLKTIYRWDIGMPMDAVVNEEVFNVQPPRFLLAAMHYNLLPFD